MEFPDTRAAALRDHVFEQKRAGTLMREGRVKAAEIGIGPPTILKSVIDRSSLISDTESVKPGDIR
jgi:hypothetical protein